MMVRKLLTILAVASLGVSPTWAGTDSADNAASQEFNLLFSYEFTEADLQKLEKSSVTHSTALPDDYTVAASNAVAALGDSDNNQLVQWTGADGKSWSISIDRALNASEQPLHISTPLVEAMHTFGEDAHELDTSLNAGVSAIPEPATLGVLIFGIALVHRHVRRDRRGKGTA